MYVLAPRSPLPALTIPPHWLTMQPANHCHDPHVPDPTHTFSLQPTRRQTQRWVAAPLYMLSSLPFTAPSNVLAPSHVLAPPTCPQPQSTHPQPQSTHPRPQSMHPCSMCHLPSTCCPPVLTCHPPSSCCHPLCAAVTAAAALYVLPSPLPPPPAALARTHTGITLVTCPPLADHHDYATPRRCFPMTTLPHDHTAHDHATHLPVNPCRDPLTCVPTPTHTS